MVSVPGYYEATEESLARHHAPDWWRDAKFGVLITWGPYSVPAFAKPTDSFFAFAEWYWLYQQLEPGELEQAIPEASAGSSLHRDHHRRVYGEGVDYDDLLDRWKAEAWEPGEWVDLIERSGAKYFVLTAKHHDGLALWPTATSDRNSVALGPGRDIVGELLEAAADSPLRAGLFYAMAEWFTPAPHPDVVADVGDPLFDLAFNRQRRARNTYTETPEPYRGYRPIEDYARDHVIPQIQELAERYQPSILWFDLPGDPDYYQVNRLVADFYNSAASAHPEGVLVNDRAGLDARGDFHAYEYGHRDNTADSSIPSEACRSIGTSFGYNAAESDRDYASAADLIATLVDVVSEGGNLLLNIGPRADGTIDPRQAQRLLQIGQWLETNGEAIYGSRPWTRQADGDLRFTSGADGSLYVIAPQGTDLVDVPVTLAAEATVELVGSPGALAWVTKDGRTSISPPSTIREPAVPGAPFVLRLGPVE